MHKLSTWLLLAIAFVAVVAVTATGLHLASLFALLHVPAVLALLLLVRAGVLVMQNRPFALQWRGRRVLGGRLGLWLPALFLIAWTFVRENGWLDADARASRAEWRQGSQHEAWRERTGEPLLPAGITVNAPDDVFGSAIAAAIPDHWLTRDQRLVAVVTVDGDAPFRPWPLYKSATLACAVTVDMQLQPQRGDGVVRTSSMKLEIEGTWTTFGFCSQRTFHRWLGTEIGEKVHDAIRKAAQRALAK